MSGWQRIGLWVVLWVIVVSLDVHVWLMALAAAGGTTFVMADSKRADR